MLSTMGLMIEPRQASTSIANADPAARFRDKMATLGTAWADRNRQFYLRRVTVTACPDGICLGRMPVCVPRIIATA
jgi:hypothetical protein